MIELTDQELLEATEQEWKFYNEVILPGLPTMAGKNGDGLDKFGVHIPYHSGPHILRHFMETISIVNPKRIFEIGFNMGHSSRMWLELCNANVVSCDVSMKDETRDAALFMYVKYDMRFRYFDRNLIEAWGGFDLAFVDGAHDEYNITTDIELVKSMKIPYVLFDDWYPRYGETQQAVAKFPELELVKDMNNLRLYKVNYDN